MGVQSDCPDGFSTCNQLVVIRENNNPAVLTPNAYSSSFTELGKAGSTTGHGSGGAVTMVTSSQELRAVHTMKSPTDGFSIKFHTNSTSRATIANSGSDVSFPTAAAFCGSSDMVAVVGDDFQPRLYNFNDASPTTQLGGSQTALDPLVKSVDVVCDDFDGDGIIDVMVHRTSDGAGSCAFRCHENNRFGYDRNWMRFRLSGLYASGDDDAFDDD